MAVCSTLKTVMQQCNVLPSGWTGKSPRLNKMEQSGSAQFHPVTPGIFGAVKRLIGPFKHHFAALTRFECRHTHGDGYRYPLTFEVKRASLNGCPQRFGKFCTHRQ